MESLDYHHGVRLKKQIVKTGSVYPVPISTLYLTQGTVLIITVNSDRNFVCIFTFVNNLTKTVDIWHLLYQECCISTTIL